MKNIFSYSFINIFKTFSSLSFNISVSNLFISLLIIWSYKYSFPSVEKRQNETIYSFLFCWYCYYGLFVSSVIDPLKLQSRSRINKNPYLNFVHHGLVILYHVIIYLIMHFNQLILVLVLNLKVNVKWYQNNFK